MGPKMCCFDPYGYLIIKDDGKGINPDIISKNAIEKGIYTEDQISNLIEKEIIEIIFEPSFSQKESVDELSGRGIGMDVVRKNIESLHGTIEIKSKVGEGTEFILNFKSNKAG